jgi:phospholipid/cholesterol/gamma-HCH transport system substrate-binding protein
MVKQAPTPARLLTMVLFALSCFGLLLFLWLSFGGSVPLKPKGYRVEVSFPEATQLGDYADVRTAGVSVGKVRLKKLDPKGNRTIATLELDRRFAPLHVDAKAILRQKTLLGETYVELTPGKPGSPYIPEGGRLKNAQVKGSVQLDEIFRAFDPQTRHKFRVWQQAAAQAIDDRGQDLNDAIGNLPRFAADATDVLDVLHSQGGAVRRLFKNTGVVFNALSQNEQALHGLIVNTDRVFSATQSQQNALKQTFAIFPTFLDESKATQARLQSFATDTHPLVRELRPVARDLKPTLRDVREFSPDLRSTFQNLDPLITVSKQGLPALRDTLNNTGPVLAQLAPFLGQLNPILDWLQYNQHMLGDFIGNGGGALSDVAPISESEKKIGAIGHYLRQLGPGGTETVAVYQQRPQSERGNSYLGGTQLQGPLHAKYNIQPSMDCSNTKIGEFQRPELPTTDNPQDPSRTPQNGSDPKVGKGPSCWVQPLPGASGPDSIPHILPKDYLKATPQTK